MKSVFNTLLFLLLFAPCAEATTYSCTHGLYSMSADVTLTGGDIVDLEGSALTRCLVLGNGYRFKAPDASWVGSFIIKFSDVVGCGDTTHKCVGNLAGDNYAYLNNGTLLIEDSLFTRGGALHFNLAGSSLGAVKRTTFAADMLISVDYNVTLARPVFIEEGTATAVKYFQGNKVYRSWVDLGSPNWIVGAASGCTTTCDSDGNLFIGKRAGLYLKGDSCYASYNFGQGNLEVTPSEPTWTQVAMVGAIGNGCIIENNVFTRAHWVIQGGSTNTGATIRYNVILQQEPHQLLRFTSTSATWVVRGNIMGGRYPGINTWLAGTRPASGDSGFLISNGNTLEFRNNTMDFRGASVKATGWVDSGASLNFRNNVSHYLALLATGCNSGVDCGSGLSRDQIGEAVGYSNGSPAARLTYADYNDWFFTAASPRKIPYDLTVSGKSICGDDVGQHDLWNGAGCHITTDSQGVDPLFAGTLPLGSGFDGGATMVDSGFPFSIEDIISGKRTVSQMLAYYRYVYAPGVGSPLINAQDPGDAGGNVGAAQSTPSEPTISSVNKAPVVYAGPNITVTSALGSLTCDSGTLPKTICLAGIVADDGKGGASFTQLWSLVRGPGTATFANRTLANTRVDLSAAGVYTLRLTAKDGTLEAHSDTQITVTLAANVYYVSPSGNDGNSCAVARSTMQANQKLTIRAGVACLSAGDTLYIHGGTYTGAANTIDSTLGTVPSGTNLTTGAVTISGYPSETVTIQHPNGTAGVQLIGSYAYLIFQDITIDGINGTNAGISGILYLSQGVNHTRFLRVEVKNAYNNGVNVYSSGTNSPYNEFLNCSVHGNGRRAVVNSGYGFYVDSTDGLFEGNDIYSNSGYGMQVINDRNVIRLNSIHGNGTGGGTNYAVDLGASAYPSTDGSLVYNNRIWGNRGGILVYSNSLNTGVYNNTFYNNTPGGAVDVQYTTGTSTIRNNIFRSNGTDGVTDNGQSGGTITADHNLTTDPSFTNAGAADFTLQSGSVARDTATAVSLVTVDYAGVSRPQGPTPDMGAYEYVLSDPRLIAACAAGGVVTLSARADVNAAVQAQAAGTTFCFNTGTYSLDAVIEPKNDDRFIGLTSGVILTGHGAIASAFHGFGGAESFSQQRVTLSNLELVSFTGSAIEMGWYWDVRWVNSHLSVSGVTINGYSALTFSHIHHNTQYGVIGGPGTDMSVISNEVDTNNTSAYCGGGCNGDAGGSKIVGSSTGTYNLIWRNNNVHDNTGPGMWSDGNVRATYEWNTVTNNSDVGVFHELSWDAIIRDNTVTNNGIEHAGQSCYYGANIHVNTSTNVDIYRNTVTASNGTNGICAAASNRGDAVAPYPTDTLNITVHGNTVKVNGSATSGLVADGGESYAGSSFATGTWYVTGGTGAWWVWPTAAASPATFTQWQTAGQDAAGVVRSW